MMEFQTHEGTQPEKPPELDTVSSTTVVYVRRNINQKERVDERTGETTKYWEYEEAVIPREKYAEYMVEQANAKIDYIIMMQEL